MGETLIPSTSSVDSENIARLNIIKLISMPVKLTFGHLPNGILRSYNYSLTTTKIFII